MKKTSKYSEKTRNFGVIINFNSFVFLFPLFASFQLNAQLNVTTSITPAQMVELLVGTGVSYSNVTYSGHSQARGAFTNGNATNLGLNSGICLSTGRVTTIPGPVSNFASANNNGGGDPQLQSLIPGYTVYDATKLEFKFIPQASPISFRFVFGSEEYPEWVLSPYNDVFGFFVTGPSPGGGNYVNKNIATIPGTSLPVTIDNINNVIPSYPQYYVDNQALGGTTIVYDGFTKVLTATLNVIPCSTYHIKIVIGDAGDHIYDSGIFLEENSFISPIITHNISYSPPGSSSAIEGIGVAHVYFMVSTPAPESIIINYTIGGTATNGVDYLQIPSSVTIPKNSTFTQLIIHPLSDGLAEETETVTLAYKPSQCAAQSTITIFITEEILLIELLEFTAQVVENYVLITWSTASEKNNDYFTVERSIAPSNLPQTEELNFSPIGTVDGAGNSNTIQYYQCIDVSPPLGEGAKDVLLYRLKQTDFDGNYEYSEIISVNIPDKKYSFNPIITADDGIVSISFGQNISEEVLIHIISINGETVYKERMFIKDSSIKLNKKFASGVYLINIHRLIDEKFLKKLFVF